MWCSERLYFAERCAPQKSTQPAAHRQMSVSRPSLTWFTNSLRATLCHRPLGDGGVAVLSVWQRPSKQQRYAQFEKVAEQRGHRIEAENLYRDIDHFYRVMPGQA